MNKALKRRNAHFMAAVKRTAAAWEGTDVEVSRIIEAAATGPAPEFYVTFDTARRYISLTMRNKLPKSMSDTRRRMWIDLTAKVTALMKRRSSLTISDALSTVLASKPAPSFYITPQYARNLYYKLANNTTP